MKLVLCLCVIVATNVAANHLIVGNVANRVVPVKHELVEYNAIPFFKRVKTYFYSQPDNQLIQGIQALDTLHSKATINITSGGVGYTYVNLRMKSERGLGLSYDIAIYVQDSFYH